MVDHTQNELWQAFFTEVSEQLDNLELILVDPDAAQRADIHQLFRDFHTIKSSCAMMDFHSMERIAHASEDYLDIVRKGRAALNSDTISMLLKGIDWLKTQMQLTRTTGNTPGENPELHTSLLALSAQFATPARSTSNEAEKSRSENDGGNTPNHTFSSGAPDVPRLSDDEINEFASACKAELLGSLAADADPVKTKRSLNKLVSICNLVGFTALSSLLKKFIKLKTANEIQRSQEVAAEILNRLEIIEKDYQVDCGSHAVHSLFLDALFPDFAQSSGRLEFILDSMEENPDDDDTIIQCETLLHALSIYASLFGFHQLKLFYRYTLQTLRSIRRGDIPDKIAAFYALRQAFDFPAAEQLHAGETTEFRESLQKRQADLNVGITHSLYSAGHDHAREIIAGILEIERASLDLLMPGSLIALHDIVQAGKPLFDVAINLDSDQTLVDQMIQVLTENTQVLHNRSIYDQKTGDFFTCLSFLVASDTDIATVITALKSVNANGEHFRCKPLRYLKDISSAAPANKSQDTQPSQGKTASINATLRIDSTALDNLVTQVGEMIMIRNMMAHALHDSHIEDNLATCMKLLEATPLATTQSNPEESAGLDDSQRQQLQHTLLAMNAFRHQVESVNNRMQTAIAAIQERILDLRVVPVSAVFDRIPQLVRKMADTQKKDIRLIISGKDVRIDKGMVDILMEPLIHLVRNCIDHGIEPPVERIQHNKPAQATLTLSASQEGSTLVLRIADDGRGINVGMIRASAIRKGFINATDALTDEETYKLIFLPGFSTAETITETSGRGVGMDVVITRINHIGGDIDVQSRPGHGTQFFLKLPLSAAIQGVVLARAESRLYAIPQNSIIEVIPMTQQDVHLLHGQSALRLRGSMIPAFRLVDLILSRGVTTNNHLHFEPLELENQTIAIILGYGTQRIAVVVDDVAGREDVFIRGLHKDLRNLDSLSGAAVLGNGQLVLILNSANLLQQASHSAAFQLSQQTNG